MQDEEAEILVLTFKKLVHEVGLSDWRREAVVSHEQMHIVRQVVRGVAAVKFAKLRDLQRKRMMDNVNHIL